MSRIIAICVLALALAGHAAPPPKAIGYQGHLANPAGQPVNATVSMTFKLYAAPSGGGALWTEAQPAVVVTQGVFNVVLGAVTPLNLPFDAAYYLGVSVGADPEMTPRLPLLSSPYAIGSVTPPRFFLSVVREGNGTGAVSSSPAGIYCAPWCLADFEAGQPVTLTAAADPATSTFAGWTGACSGTGTCNVTLDATRSVGATFVRNMHSLVTSRVGPGSLISMPTGIYCGLACSDLIGAGTTVTLTPIPDSGASFGSWSGACSGTNPSCNVTIDGNKTVGASFGYLLSVTPEGTGSGQVTTTPAGISCPGTCQFVFAPGTVVTLTAVAAGGSNFIGWSGGGCTGNGTCNVTMNSAASVYATFLIP